ncbi:MAG: hypothetical protein LBV11_01200 [Bacillus cereus]|jgi:hypothetical protein|nr:hypothetical protein [Bacillus cereus]
MKHSNNTKIIFNYYNSTIYGFMTIRDSRQMVAYDGKQFQKSEEFKAMFSTMEQDKER